VSWVSLIWLFSLPLTHILPVELGQMDLQQYWGAAKAFIHHQNPYHITVMSSYQAELGIITNSLWIRLWNPPQIMTLIWPLGLVEFEHAIRIFLLLNLSIVIAVLLLIDSNQSSSKYQHEISFKISRALCILSFYPLISCLSYGQFSIILLFGLVLFLSLKGRFFAGMALSLTLLKPHLLYLVYIAIVLESLRCKDFKIILGLTSGTILLFLPTLIYSPNILSWYLTALSEPPLYFKTPTLGSWLHELFGYEQRWVRILPSLLVSLGYVYYWISQKINFSRRTLLYLIPISLISSPYGWVFDQVLMLPSLLYIVSQAFNYSSIRRNTIISITILSGVLVFVFPLSSQQYYIWYPLLLWGILLKAGAESH